MTNSEVRRRYSTLHVHFATTSYNSQTSIMASLHTPTVITRALAASSRPATCARATAAFTRRMSTAPRTTPLVSTRTRPRTAQQNTSATRFLPVGMRTIFIQTENTPNPDAVKFVPNHRVLPEGTGVPFVEFLTPRSTIAPPHPSPLAAKLMNMEGITAVFYGADFITVTKGADVNWAHVRPEIFALITEAITSGEALITAPREGEQVAAEADSLAYNEDDTEVVGMIKELLETRIRPAIQEDGGDIEFRGFEEGLVLLKLRGACRTCDSSTVTLKNGIEGMLMHYVSTPNALPMLY